MVWPRHHASPAKNPRFAAGNSGNLRSVREMIRATPNGKTRKKTVQSWPEYLP